MTQIWVALILYLLLSYIKITGKCRYGITELANRLRDTLMSDFALVEILKRSCPPRPRFLPKKPSCPSVSRALHQHCLQ